MAVDAHGHIPFFPPPLMTQREMMAAGGDAAAVQIPAFYGQSESGVTFNNAATVSRKRARNAAAAAPAAVSFLGEDFSVHLQQQLSEVDRVVFVHMERMRAELAERRRRLVAAVQSVAAKRLRAKDDEIARLAKLNAQLDERVRALGVENQLWCDLAQYNEAAVTALRGDLERALAAHPCPDGSGCAAAPDAESCCGGGNGADAPEQASPAVRSARACRGCGVAEASVLLLPCRHLSACAACCPMLPACPACGGAKNGSVTVNLVE